MKISYNWLQHYIEEKLPEPEVLAEKIVFGAFEVEDVEKLATGDTVFEIKVLPDRAHDCLSHYGIAREVCGLLGLTLKPLTFKNHESVTSDVQVTIETDVCRRYIGRKVFGVTVGPSPAWLVERLESIGQRSINNIVDATNYIMFGLGQPIHAFDYDKVSHGKIIIRNATEGEQITTLDGKEITLDPSIVVITDCSEAPSMRGGQGGVLAIAGIKGGNAAEVTSDTKSIIIEVANFDPVSVRKTARKLGILTDSAKRFENELTPHLVGTIIHIITDLICELAGGQPCDPIDDYKKVAVQNTITFSSDYINNILGTDIAHEEIKTILNNYGYNFQEEDELFKVLIPYGRLDLIGPHDMVEEIGRAYGYEKIVPALPHLDFKPTRHETFDTISAIKLDLISKGYNEVMTYSFTKKGDFEVARGPVGKSALRTNLSDGLKVSYELNKQNADLLGISEMKIFEIGTVFPKVGTPSAQGYGGSPEVVHVAFADKKGTTEMTLDEYVSKNSIEACLPLLGGVPEGRGGTEVFKIWSEYPFITRDIALWIPSETNPDEVLEILKTNGTSLLAREPKLFDTFSKDGKTSVAFRLVFQSFERTLTNEEVDKVMEVVYEKIKEKGWEVR